MHLFHPVMFVGLGGTGCQIGAELERRLREELCGPDGRKLQGPEHNLNELRPFELPSCLQFIYADLSEEELGQVRQRSVPNAAHVDVASQTAYYAYDLLPEFPSYPQVAQNLRIKSSQVVGDWLPPSEHEPMVVPLRLGAGQLPTVGRAALYETISDSIDVVREPIRRAIGSITNSGMELRALNPAQRPGMETVDVFVAFSVAGGTGAGIFYDYLHIIESAFAKANLNAKIYPLILMPSAFESGRGGGINASLNAGRALLDMFRLIDDLNQDSRAHRDLSAERVSQGLHVRYRREGDIMMRLGSIQTAFLFSRAAGIERDDLHRSVVALIMSVVGLDAPPNKAGAGGQAMSFADSFINGSVDRQTMSPTRIGRRPVSTSLVGSLTVPFDDLADMFVGRLLGRGVRELIAVPPGRAESNRALIRDFFDGAYVGPIWRRAGEPYDDPAAGETAKGATAIREMLKERVTRMQDSLTSLDQYIVSTMPDLVRDFAPLEGGRVVLRKADLFRLKRVLYGDAALSEEIDRLGVRGVMEARRVPPAAPIKEWENDPRPPQLVDVRDRLGGMRRARADEPPVTEMVELQDDWFGYRTRRLWHAGWNDHRSTWQQRLSRFAQQLRGLVDELSNHERESEETFNRRAENLYRARVGVTYLLPPRNDLEQTYEQILRRLAKRGKRENATEGEIVSALIGEEGWGEALAAASTIGRGAEHGVQLILARLKQEVVRILRGGDPDDMPLLPHMGQLLRVAAKRVHGVPVADTDVQHFVATLSGMLPSSFVPAGNGQLDVLVVYPAAEPDDEIERWLTDELRLATRRNDRAIQFRAGQTESITVVRVRSGMGVTDVPELRDVLLDWADAVRRPRADSYLPWRQRLGFEADWLATTEVHRQEILQRLLCTAWNGQIECWGDAGSPDRIRIALKPDPGAEAMVLELTAFGKASSWGSLLRQYEVWTLTDGGEIRLNFCSELMETVPIGFATTVADPDPLYWELISMAERQVKLLKEMRDGMPEGSRQRCEQLIKFWDVTFSKARDRTFMGEAPNGNSLRALETTVKNRRPEQ